jgi:hypothetical protein
VNAPTTIAAPWERYRPALDSLKPGCGDEEARYRCGLMVMRDQALKFTNADPTGLMRVVWLNASEAALRVMTAEQLKECWGALGQAFTAARRLGKVSDDLIGGSDARG